MGQSCPFPGRLGWLCVGMDQCERKGITTAAEFCGDVPSGTALSASPELTLFDDCHFDRPDPPSADDQARIPQRRSGRRRRFPTTPDDAVPEGETLQPRLVSIIEAARLLGVGRSTLYELISSGELKVVHIGRSARIPVRSVDAFVSKLQRVGEPDAPSTAAAVRSRAVAHR